MEVLNGSNLIHTLVSLTDLPEPLVHQEVDEILTLSGHESESLTLEQLRSAMLSYLESIQATMEAEHDAAELDVGSKTLVFFE